MCLICLFKQKTAYEMRISDWSSDVCSSDLRQCGHYRVTLVTDHGKTRTRIKIEFFVHDPKVTGMIEHTLDTDNSILYVKPDDKQIGRASCRESECKYV